MGFSGLALILVEAALEPIPRELWGNPTVVRVARRLGRDPQFMPLDKSLHYRAMRGLPSFERRGRPDIVHKFLLDTMNSILASRGLLRVYIHTIGGLVIEVAPNERPPQNYINFLGLMEQLFKHGSVPPGDRWLLRILNESLDELLDKLNMPMRILLERDGEGIRALELAKAVVSSGGAVIMVGGLPRGNLGEGVRRLADRVFSLAGGQALTTSHVVNSVLISVESVLGLI